MRKTFVFVVLAVMCVASAAVAAQVEKQEGAKVHWLTDFNAGLRQAKLQNKPILLDFFNPN